MALLFRNINKTRILFDIFKYNLSTLQNPAKILVQKPDYIHFCDAWGPEHAEISENLCRDMVLHHNFLSTTEENNLFSEIEPYLKRMRYEFDHWDDAIHGFRETERLNWNEVNTKIINRVREIAFSKNVTQLKHVHVLDLAPKGYIKPHIDAVRFCGNTITGLSLLSDSVMRLVHDKQKNLYVDVLLKRFSLYIMKDSARYDYTHEILEDQKSFFKSEKINRDRRISIICRNEPK